MPRRLAVFSTATTTDPPGKVAIDLDKILLSSIHIIKQVKDERKDSMIPSDDAMF